MAVIAGLVVFFVIGQSSSSDNRKGSGGGAIIVIIVAVALIALAWLLSQMVRLALSRSREYLADAGSVELTKNPDAMISALRKIENRGELPGATSAVMELCLDNPREGFSDLFATHPSVDSPRPGTGEIRRRARSRAAGVAALADQLHSDDQDPPDDQTPPPVPKGPWSDATDRRRTEPRLTGRRAGPWGSATDPLLGPWGRH